MCTVCESGDKPYERKKAADGIMRAFEDNGVEEVNEIVHMKGAEHVAQMVKWATTGYLR